MTAYSRHRLEPHLGAPGIDVEHVLDGPRYSAPSRRTNWVPKLCGWPSATCTRSVR